MSAANAKTAWEIAQCLAPGRWLIARTDSTAAFITAVDPEDEHLLDGVRWRISAYGYVERDLWDATVGRSRRIFLARVILDAPAGLDVDHRNRDRLDNRRANLRLATRAQNRQNVTSYGRTSRYRGVSFDRRAGRWEASYGRPRRFRERHDTEEAAALAAWRWRVQNLAMCRDEPCPVQP